MVAREDVLGGVETGKMRSWSGDKPYESSWRWAWQMQRPWGRKQPGKFYRERSSTEYRRKAFRSQPPVRSGT